MSGGPADGVSSYVLSARELADVELAALGLLPGGHLLGGPFEPTTAPGAVPADALDRSGIRMFLTPQTAERACQDGGLSLTDDELTPVARLRAPRALATSPQGWQVGGHLELLRRRESGTERDLALGPGDLTGPAPSVLLVAARPPVAADHAGIGAQGLAGARVLALVPDRAEDCRNVPPSTMVTLVTDLVARLDGDPASLVRVAPLAWRGPDSDDRLVAMLAAHLGVDRVLTIGVGRPTPAETQWDETLAQLQAGGSAPIDTLDPADEAHLRRWLPSRPERGLVVLFTGLSGSGKSTLARGLADHLRRRTERSVTLLDGDVVRQMLSSELGFDRRSRDLNVRRIGYVASEIARHGGVAICAPIAPYAQTRAAVRAMAQATGGFVLVHVNTPLAECERRDLKGLYAKARAGLIAEFTGVSDPYEEPTDADLRIDTSAIPPDQALDRVVRYLEDAGWLRRRGSATGPG